MVQPLEMYVKEKNLLQLSLFYFGKGRPKETVVEWEGSDDICRLECICKYGVPGAFDQDVYAAALRAWVEQNMPHECIRLTYSDIARILRLKSSKNSVGKIKKSLEKLGQARYELKRCFFKANGDKDEVVHFSLFDTVILHNKKNNNSKYTELYFPDIIRDNLEAKYYQRLDMKWYRALPSGLPRRLYEFLEKRRYHGINGVFSISEESLCRWLPITDSHTTNRRKTLEGIAQNLIDAGYLFKYDFDRIKKQCIFTYAKNAVPPKDNNEPPEEKKCKSVDVISTESEIVENIREDITTPQKLPQEIQNEQVSFVEALDWIQSIPYFHLKKRQEIASLPMSEVVLLYPSIREMYEKKSAKGTQPKASWVYNQFVKNVKTTHTLANKNEEKKPQKANKVCHKQLEQADFFVGDNGAKIDEEIFKELVTQTKPKKVSKSLMSVIKDVFAREGYDYVKWNILYANKKAKKNYGNYLEQALKENWGANFAEIEKQKMEVTVKNEKVVENMPETLKTDDEEKEDIEKLFLEKTALLDKEIKLDFWQAADKAIAKNAISRGMNVKIEYFNRLKKYFNENGENFFEDATTDLKFVKKVAKEMESLID